MIDIKLEFQKVILKKKATELKSAVESLPQAEKGIPSNRFSPSSTEERLARIRPGPAR